MEILNPKVTQSLNKYAGQLAKGLYTKELQEELIESLAMLESDELEDLLWSIQPFLSKHENRYELYNPLPFSYQFHHSTAKNRWMFGANRTSKTFGSMMDMLFSFCGFLPESMKGMDERDHTPKVPLWRYNTAKNLRWLGVSRPQGLLVVAIPMFENFCPEYMIADWSPGSLTATSKFGSTLGFMSYTQFTEHMAGAKLERIHYDEEPTQDAFGENEKRILQGGEITGSMTPEKGVTYIHDAVVLRAKRSYVSVPKDPGRLDNPHRQFGDKFDPDRKMVLQTRPGNERYKTETFHPTLYDNKYMPLENITDILLKFEFDRRKQEIAVLGEFTSSSGRVFNRFDRGKHVVPNAWCLEHLDPDWPRFVSVDCHPESPFACTMICCMPGNIRIVEKEIRIPADDPDLFEKIIDWENEPVRWKGDLRNRWVVWRIMDPLGQTRWLGKKSIFDLFRAYLVNCGKTKNYSIRPWTGGNDARNNGIFKVREALCPPRLSEDAQERRPQLYVNETCINVIEEFEHWMFFPPTKQWKARHGAETNKPQDKLNHFMSCIYSAYLEPGFMYITRPTEAELEEFEEHFLRAI